MCIIDLHRVRHDPQPCLSQRAVHTQRERERERERERAEPLTDKVYEGLENSGALSLTSRMVTISVVEPVKNGVAESLAWICRSYDRVPVS